MPADQHVSWKRVPPRDGSTPTTEEPTRTHSTTTTGTRMYELRWDLRKRLTDRQYEVARLLIEGKPFKTIGQELQITHGTVKVHAGNIYDALGVRGRTRLALLFKTNTENNGPARDITVSFAAPPMPGNETSMADLYARQVANRAFFFRSLNPGSLDYRVLGLISEGKSDDELLTLVPELENPQRFVARLLRKAYAFNRASLGRVWRQWQERT